MLDEEAPVPVLQKPLLAEVEDIARGKVEDVLLLRDLWVQDSNILGKVRNLRLYLLKGHVHLVDISQGEKDGAKKSLELRHHVGLHDGAPEVRVVRTKVQRPSELDPVTQLIEGVLEQVGYLATERRAKVHQVLLDGKLREELAIVLPGENLPQHFLGLLNLVIGITKHDEVGLVV